MIEFRIRMFPNSQQSTTRSSENKKYQTSFNMSSSEYSSDSEEESYLKIEEMRPDWSHYYNRTFTSFESNVHRIFNWIRMEPGYWDSLAETDRSELE